MKKTLLLLCMLVSITSIRAQFVVTDPTNFWGNVTNTFKQLSEASKSLQMLERNASEVTRLADQYKEYYDKLKKVNNYIQGAREVGRVYDLLGTVVNNYTSGVALLTKTDYLSLSERERALNVYKDLLKDANAVVTDVKDVVLTTKYEMSDSERLNRLDQIIDKLEMTNAKVRLLRKRTARIIAQRSRNDNREAAGDRMWGKNKGVKGY